MIRLRTSTLETFRIVCEDEYIPEEELIARLRRGQWTDDPKEDKVKLEIGTAWHKALAFDVADDLSQIDVGLVGYNGFFFAQDDVHQGIAYSGAGVRELTSWRTWEVSGVAVQMEGTCDQIQGRIIQDHKTKIDTVNVGFYERSLQWRTYLLIHDGSRFTYNVWRFKPPTNDNFLALKEVTSVTFWPYPDMEADVVAWVRRFVEWAKQRRLLHLLEVSR